MQEQRPTADAATAPEVSTPHVAPRVDGVSVVPVEALPIDQFASVLAAEQMRTLHEATVRARSLFDGRVIWHVNSTAKGGGVAEMLTALLPYARGTGVDARWLVIAGDDAFFRVTKRIHNHLHGNDGDSPQISAEDMAHYGGLTRARAEVMTSMVSPRDVVVLHDPQTAGLIPVLARHCAGVVWRCHVGLDQPNQRVRETWQLLLPYVRESDAVIFSRKQFAWDGLQDHRVEIFAPSIDPFSAKNRAIEAGQVAAILNACGVIPGASPNGEVTFERQDGSTSPIIHRADIAEDQPIPSHARLVAQVSRWDRLKDPLGVLEGFRRGVPVDESVHLALVGPSVAEVVDDPEGHEVYVEVLNSWRALPEELRARVHLVCLPMDDDQENAAMVNALQRRADVVVQKSLAEGFGLTVAEAMWKWRPMVASAVGGIQDQIEDGVSGLLVRDPRDLDGFGTRVRELLQDPQRAQQIGDAAHDRVRDHFLGTRALLQYQELLSTLRP